MTSATQKTPTVLVVDDQRELAELVQRALEQEGFDVVIADSGEAGLEIARAHRPDLIVLDLGMPGIDGLEVCRELRADPRQRRLPILVLSARASEADRVLGLETGADDYLVKPFGPRELVARVRALLRRSVPEGEDRAVLRDGDFEVDFHRHVVRWGRGGCDAGLTASEFRIVALLALHPHRVYSRDEILSDIAGGENGAVTERTVDVHINSIRKKLADAANRIVTVRGVGYKFEPRSE
jgi:DNA-binding response OmpR family regulator